MKTIARILACLACLGGVSACGAAQAAAGRDPMKCERDPTCAKGRGSYIDCTRQCADNPECMDHCRTIQVDPGVGH
jgi:hypothetical protein